MLKKQQNKTLNQYLNPRIRSFKKEVKKLPKIEIPERIRVIAEREFNFKFRG